MTLAVIGRVIDRGVVIGMLLSGEQVQAIQDQRAARTSKYRPNVVPRECRTERHGVQVNGTVATLMGLSSCDVVGTPAFALDAMIVHPRRIAHHDFRHAVRPVRTLAERRVRLDDARAGLPIDDDESTRICNHLFVAARQEQQLDRLRDRRLRRHMNERSFVHERRIQG